MFPITTIPVAAFYFAFTHAVPTKRADAIAPVVPQVSISMFKDESGYLPMYIPLDGTTIQLGDMDSKKQVQYLYASYNLAENCQSMTLHPKNNDTSAEPHLEHATKSLTNTTQVQWQFARSQLIQSISCGNTVVDKTQFSLTLYSQTNYNLTTTAAIYQFDIKANDRAHRIYDSRLNFTIVSSTSPTLEFTKYCTFFPLFGAPANLSDSRSNIGYASINNHVGAFLKEIVCKPYP